VQAVFDDKEKGRYVVAECDGKVIASLLITLEWSDWRNGFFWWIQSVYVDPRFRRKGVFSKLYSFIEAKAQNDPDVFGLRLYVERSNEPAQQTYGSLGMRQTGYYVFQKDYR
jgi:GNAT superfamily N-acetyltransferase